MTATDNVAIGIDIVELTVKGDEASITCRLLQMPAAVAGRKRQVHTTGNPKCTGDDREGGLDKCTISVEANFG
ncbi:hypothetical protein Ae201684P_013266 [Aphanomyces euteiches]|nr:hypothetical protein Ae201684P_013266 [Aphanomyces euteiches]